MSAEQHAAYDNATEVYSDALGIIQRNNRNHQKKLTLIQDATAATPGDDIIEVGCGHGIHATHYDTTYNYTGVDLSTSLVSATNAKLEHGIAHTADAHNLPYPSSWFDAVVGSAILHHLHDQRGALDEWIRVTKAGGSVTLIEPNYYFPKDYLSAHIVPEEQHKTRMTHTRLNELLSRISERVDITWRLTRHIYTPPWPRTLTPLYDHIDTHATQIPGLRYLNQLHRIHIEVYA